MKCPKCGKEIEDGSLFCKYCFADIKIVPTYDSKVEQSINEVMSDIGHDIGKTTEREKIRKKRSIEVERAKKKLRLMLFAMAAGAVLVFLIMLVIQRMQMNSESYYVAKAYELSEDEDYIQAAAQIDKAIELSEKTDPTLLYQKAEYLNKADDFEAAAECIQQIISKAADSTEMLKAYYRLIELYSSRNMYDKIAEVLEKCGDNEIRNTYSEYMAPMPTFDCEPGSYDNKLILKIKSQGNGSVFYTLDGSVPDTDSLLYDGTIELLSGAYDVKAVYVNHFGVRSECAMAHYVILDDRPAAPDVSPASGTYTGKLNIRVDVPDKMKAYYTTDGTDPTQDSKIYSGPIAAPLGTSCYKFILVNDDGRVSDPTEVRYTRQINAKISKEDGPNYIIIAMINLGEVIQPDGTIQGGAAKFTYTYQKTKEFQGYGSFYIYSETLVDAAGNTANTGRVFAVNVQNGTVNLLDGSGNPVPIE